MRVRTTILLLLLLAGTAFVAGLVEMRRVEKRKLEITTSAWESTWRGRVEGFWEKQFVRFQKDNEELIVGPEVLGSILDGKRKWAEEKWDTHALITYRAHAIWVYRKNGTLFYSCAVRPLGDLPNWPGTPEQVVKLFGRDKAPRFYVRLPSSINGHVRLLEVLGTPVRPQWDENKQESAEAYVLVGRVWDNDELAVVLPPDDGEAHFQPADKRISVTLEPGEMQDVLPPLRDWQGRDLARLVFSSVNAQVADFERRSDRLFVELLLGALVLFVVLFLLLERAIVHPLRRVIRSLHGENLALLDPLSKQKAEFGELSRLIQLFFAQQMELVREMSERHAAEKALHDSEEMLRHSQKMEAVGRLAGGVAHDFNNLLTAIIGYADLLRQRFADTPGARQPADLIHQAGEQAAGLTRQLLAFSRKQLLQPRVIDLNTIISNLQRLLQRIIGEHIRIVAQTDAQHPRVKADPGQIEQVIVNLGVNARDAMPRGGTLTIRTRDMELTEESRPAELAAGLYVALEVTDTGEGMDEETKTRIFEPFFTTKGPGKGTGLGLATVYGIVKQSHGGIVVESERGKGSTFRILLPREDGPVETAASVPVIPKSAAKDETILLVEDEDIVRQLVREILQEQGYRVLAADRGSEALRMLSEEKCEIDLLISDVVMPEMNGATVAQRVRAMCPRVRVLFVSGYSESDMADQGLEALAFQVLQKPFTPDTLARKVREVLDLA